MKSPLPSSSTHVDSINKISSNELEHILLECCHSTLWATTLSGQHPFESIEDFYCKADAAFEHMTEQDWLEAFQAHPKIGDLNSLHNRFSATKNCSQNEQRGVSSATPSQIEQLHRLNTEYTNRHGKLHCYDHVLIYRSSGFIFIICATNKSIEDFLTSINERIKNSRETEFQIASSEQKKITFLRLKKTFEKQENTKADKSACSFL